MTTDVRAAEPHLSKAPELPALTGLRAIAALMVVLSHIRLPHGAPALADKAVESGYIGVPLFFMLSGFVLAYNYPRLNGPQDGRGTLRFYIARVARVMPLYYAVLIVLVIQRLAEGRGQFHVIPMLFAVQTWSGDIRIGSQAYNGPAWSINVELFLYLLFPLLMPVLAWLARTWGTRALVVIFAAAFTIQLGLCLVWAAKGWADLFAAHPMSGHRWLYRNPLTRVPDFVMGMCLAMLYARGIRTKAGTATALQLGVVVVTVVLTLVRPWDGPWSGLWRVLSFGALYSLPFAILLLSLAGGTGAVARMLSRPFWLTLGTASYALYMTHRPVVEAMGARGIRASDSVWGYLAIPGLVALCLLIGEGAHRYVENPCRRFILKFVKRYLPARSEAPAPAAVTASPAGGPLPQG